ncbi:MAG: LysM peptidoglycan-binding domain-containing protein, partial [Inhella sp.]
PTGKFPPIVHSSKGAIELQHLTADGLLKKVGELVPGVSEFMTLHTRLLRAFAWSGPDKPAPGSPGGALQPVRHVIQPGDTLFKIAALYKSTVGQIKQDNQLKSDKIFAGEVLSIHAPKAPATTGPQPPKRAVPRPAPMPKASQGGSAQAAKPKKTAPPAQERAVQVRSDKGDGKPLALIEVDNRVAPWMALAISEAAQHGGKTEWELDKEGVNYHKEVGTGRKQMTGSLNAWCAAFANYVLLKSGYQIDQDRAWLGRARSFYSHDQFDPKSKRFLQNPNYVELKFPIYGAIAVIFASKGGQHVGFLYSESVVDGRYIILGGNQDQQINFSQFPAEKSDKIRFFVPIAYHPQALLDKPIDSFKKYDAKELNRHFGIAIYEKKAAPEVR